MHMPDGFLSKQVALTMDGVSAATILYASRRLSPDRSARVVPMMGVLAAFVFAAQLLNFPVIGGTSGHLVGGALLGILLGPLAGFLAMTTVVIAQALILQDGGLLALGANVFNIGAVTSFSGYTIFRMAAGGRTDGRRLATAAFCAGWLSTMLSAACCSLELGLAGAIPLKIGLPAMTGYYAIIGIIEGVLTAGVLSFLSRMRPDLVRGDFGSRVAPRDWIAATVLVALPILLLILAGSSGLPDPLQKLLVPGPAPALPAEILITSGRYQDYFLKIAFCALIVVAVVIAAGVARRGKVRS
jgi:cobalt/nickel transport system permease protein